MRIVYLHGFASGPGSRKARFFRDKLAAEGIPLEAPDLAAGDFENLTISGQLDIARRTAGPGPVRLIGSSLGGYIASLLAAREPGIVEKLVLLAPAFGFSERWPQRIGQPAMAEWLRTGKLPVYHYSEGRMRNLSLAIHEDAAKWESEPEFRQPALLFHGGADDVVPISASRAFAASHPNAALTELPSGHELLDVLEDIWRGSRDFLLR